MFIVAVIVGALIGTALFHVLKNWDTLRGNYSTNIKYNTEPVPHRTDGLYCCELCEVEDERDRMYEDDYPTYNSIAERKLAESDDYVDREDDPDHMCLIKRMEAGDEGYTLPWALDIDSRGRGWINTNYPVTFEIAGTSQMPIKCTVAGNWIVNPIKGDHRNSQSDDYPNNFNDSQVSLGPEVVDRWAFTD